MGPHSLSPQVFAIFAALIEERAGLHYAVRDSDILAEKIGTRMLEAGFDSALDYYYFLRYDPAGEAEFERLIDALVVGETYFFREFDQMVALVDNVLVPAARERPIRVWSAACSTGEEPLALAMLLESRGILDRTTIVATDISHRSLERARSTTRTRRSVRNVPDPALLERWLRVEEREVTVDPALVARVEWRRLNLLDAQAVAAAGPFDAILCRNVLIYFNDDVIVRVVDALHDALRTGGLLAVGVSESLLRLATKLHCVERGGFFFYQRSPS